MQSPISLRQADQFDDLLTKRDERRGQLMRSVSKVDLLGVAPRSMNDGVHQSIALVGELSQLAKSYPLYLNSSNPSRALRAESPFQEMDAELTSTTLSSHSASPSKNGGNDQDARAVEVNAVDRR